MVNSVSHLDIHRAGWICCPAPNPPQSFNETGTIFDEVIFRGWEFQTALAEKKSK
jgi:hypothetical protein